MGARYGVDMDNTTAPKPTPGTQAFADTWADELMAAVAAGDGRRAARAQIWLDRALGLLPQG